MSNMLCKYKSESVPLVVFQGEDMNRIKKDIIERQISLFFKNHKITLKDIEEIQIEESFSDIDFVNKNIEMKYFYKKMFSTIVKKNDNYQMKTFYSITYDINLKDQSLSVYDQPFFYWVYIDLEEMMKELRMQMNQNQKHVSIKKAEENISFGF